jgi:pyrroline-5-carboxylate reductase
VEWVDKESLMDAVTAVSGSGPAYVFLLAEELARAGVAAGLPAELAARLARETVAGSGELLHRSNSRPPRCARMSPRPAAPRPPRWKC